MKSIDNLYFIITGTLILYLLPVIGNAQQEIPSIQDVFEKEQSDVVGLPEYPDLSAFEDYYQDLMLNPVNLGCVDPLGLLRLTMLEEKEMNNVYQYILDYGPLISGYELQMIEGIQKDQATELSRYIYIGKPGNPVPPLREIFRKPRIEILMTGKRLIEKRKVILNNYISENDTGTMNSAPWQQKVRIRIQSGRNLSIGVNLNNNVGEQSLISLENYRFHHSPAYLSLNHLGIVKRLILGDYGLSFGQGLAIGSGSALSLGQETDLRIQSRGLFPCLSDDPEVALHGAGLWLQSGQSGSCIFYSERPSSKDAGLYFSGGRERWKSGVGLLYHTEKFELKDDELQPYEYFAQFTHPVRFSWDSRIFLRNLSLFHEICGAENGSYALLMGGTCRPASRVTASAQWVRLPGEWNNPLAGKALVPRAGLNLSAMQTNLLFNVNRYLDIKIFSSQTRYRWLRYTTSSPSVKTSFQIILSIKPSKQSQIDFFVKRTTDQVDSKTSSFIDSLGTQERNSIGVLCKVLTISDLQFKMSVRTVGTVNPDSSAGTGWLITHDISYTVLQKRLKVAAHIAFFQTDTYNERLYAWEADVYKGFSIPAYYGQGFHFSGMVQAWITKALTASLKYSVYKYPGQTSIGSGDNIIAGNRKSQLTLQFRMNFS